MADEQPPTQNVRTNTESSSYATGGGMSQAECMEGIRKGLKDPTVRFLREQMEKAGCPVLPNFFEGVNCTDNTSAGGHMSGRGVLICCNHMNYHDEIKQVMIHELIHAYDDCRAKNLDWKNCAHHACSEIRANHLSGDCDYKRELFRGFMKIRGHEQECVKRRALKSVQKNPYCSDQAAKDAIEAVWDICYNDTMPFDRAP